MDKSLPFDIRLTIVIEKSLDGPLGADFLLSDAARQ